MPEEKRNFRFSISYSPIRRDTNEKMKGLVTYSRKRERACQDE